MREQISKGAKAGILTWCDNHGPANYGQILQCYAMQYLVKEKGYDPLVVQYRKKDQRDLLKHHFSNRTPIGRRLNESYERYYNIRVVEKEETPRVRRFKEFIESYIPLSAPCYTKEMVEEMTADCELLICGSDQIWNPIWFDPVWFLDFGTTKQKRIACAPSGIFYETSEYAKCYQKMAPLIERLDEVSIREKAGADILRKYVKKEITVRSDPTLFLGPLQWDQVSDQRLIEEDYIFCYILGRISPYQLILRELKRKYKVGKVVCIPSNKIKERGYREFEKYESAGPAQFLSLIKHASAVCTDSFHGTALSIQYGVPFYNVLRVHKGTEAFGGRERIDNLLEGMGMEKRWIRNVREIYEIESGIRREQRGESYAV